MAEAKTTTTKKPEAPTRDEFAMAALAGAIAQKNVHAMSTLQMQETANCCYLIADAMLRAREADLENT